MEAFVTVAGRVQPVLTQLNTKLVNGHGYMFVSVGIGANNDRGTR